jgi:transcriptional regulator with XRE-family HTH domain
MVFDMIMSLIHPKQALTIIASKIRDCRIDMGFTQEGLATRAGVSLAVLRKFERTGKISFESLLKLALVLELLEEIIAVFDKKQMQFHSLDEVLKKNKPKRKRGWIK